MIVTDLSASRVSTMSKCARAYRFSYIDRLPEPQERAAKIFGTVVHNGVQNWYESGRYREERLRSFVDARWWEELPRDVAIALRHCLAAEKEAANLGQLIQISRPEVKAPLMTKVYQTSEQAKRLKDAEDELRQAASKCEEMAWAKDENALQAYLKSMKIADQLELRWREKPVPLMVERRFSVEFAGLTINGIIDQVRVDPDEHGEVRVEGLDLKTGRQVLSQMEAFTQAFLYAYACEMLEDLPTPAYWTFLIARHNKPQHLEIDLDRHTKLAEEILRSTKRKIESEDWTPSFGFWCKSCDFLPLCEQEIGFWAPGEDSATLNLVEEAERAAA